MLLIAPRTCDEVRVFFSTDVSHNEGDLPRTICKLFQKDTPSTIFHTPRLFNGTRRIARKIAKGARLYFKSLSESKVSHCYSKVVTTDFINRILFFLFASKRSIDLTTIKKTITQRVKIILEMEAKFEFKKLNDLSQYTRRRVHFHPLIAILSPTLKGILEDQEFGGDLSHLLNHTSSQKLYIKTLRYLFKNIEHFPDNLHKLPKKKLREIRITCNFMQFDKRITNYLDFLIEAYPKPPSPLNRFRNAIRCL